MVGKVWGSGKAADHRTVTSSQSIKRLVITGHEPVGVGPRVCIPPVDSVTWWCP